MDRMFSSKRDSSDSSFGNEDTERARLDSSTTKLATGIIGTGSAIAMSANTIGPHLEMARSLAAQIRRRSDELFGRVVMIEAPSGEGKSRIIQEVFRQLSQPSEGVDGDAYWTSGVGTGVGANSAITMRKQLGPDPHQFVWRENVLPTFAWWHLNCEDLEAGGAADLRKSLDDQLLAHAVPLAMAAELGSIQGRRVQAEEVWTDVREAVAEVVQGKLRDGVIGQLSGYLVTPYLGDLIGVGERVARKVRTRLQRAQRLRDNVEVGETVDSQRRSEFDDIAQTIVQLATRDVPAVIVIEDMHRMSESVGDFLDSVLALAKRDTWHPVVILGTGWPEAQRDALVAFEERRKEQGERIAVSIEPLSLEDRALLICERAPGTSLEVAREVAATLTNPLLIDTWLNLGRVQAEIAGGNSVTSEVLAGLRLTLTSTVEDLYKLRWEELNGEIREALMLAMLAIPPGAPSQTYSPEIVEAAGRLARGGVHLSDGALGRAVDPARWARNTAGGQTPIDEFAASFLGMRTNDELRLPQSGRNDWRRMVGVAALGVLREHFASHSIDPDVVDPLPGVFAEWVAAIVFADGPQFAGESKAIAMYYTSLANYQDGAASEALDTAIMVVKSEEADSRLQAAALVIVASVVGTSKPAAYIENVAGKLLEIMPQLEEDLDREVVTRQLARLQLRAEARVDATRAQSQALAMGTGRGLHDSRLAAEALRELAADALDAGERRVAVGYLRAAYEATVENCGPEHRRSLEAAIVYLQVVGLDGNATEHSVLAAELATHAESVLGARNSFTFDLRRIQLRWELKIRATDELAGRYDKFVEECEMVLGRFADVTMDSRIEAAQVYSRLGQELPAMSRIDTLIAELQETRPDTDAFLKYAKWMREYQIRPYLRTAVADSTPLIRASADRESHSGGADIDLATRERLVGYYLDEEL